MSNTFEDAQLHPQDHRSLQQAKNLLENPGLMAQLTNLVGTPLEAGLKKLPKGFSKRLNSALESALMKSARGALKTISDTHQASWNKSHMASVAITGGVGGFFGPLTMAIEVPLTTTIILRSIADIARSEGEPLKSGDFIPECIKVFALGGPSKNDDSTESGYYAVRAALAYEAHISAQYLAKEIENAAAEAAAKAAAKTAVNAAKATTEKTAPRLVLLIQKVAEKLGLTYSEKFAAQLIPILGALGGASINAVFMNHFQDMARGHFIVRRLERKYGADLIKRVYNSLPSYAELTTAPSPKKIE